MKANQVKRPRAKSEVLGWSLLIELRSMLKDTGGDECQKGSPNSKLFRKIDAAIAARKGASENG